MKTALITGASSGIGASTARILAAAGWRVFAAVRRLSDTPSGPNLEPVVLDVTDPATIASALAEITAKLDGHGLDALVNNAGIGQIAPLEYVTPEDFRRIFDVNVFGLVAVTQAFLPLLRQTRGRIVNLSSVGGVLTIPFGGGLCATKHAVEAISEALRMELLPSGLHVIAIRPASINSPAAGKLASETEHVLAGFPPIGRERYEASLRHFVEKMTAQEQAGSSPDVVGQKILEALTVAHPATHYFVGQDASVFQMMGWIPEGTREHLILKKLGLPTAPPES